MERASSIDDHIPAVGVIGVKTVDPALHTSLTYAGPKKSLTKHPEPTRHKGQRDRKVTGKIVFGNERIAQRAT
jgi:hypothetical protein